MLACGNDSLINQRYGEEDSYLGSYGEADFVSVPGITPRLKNEGSKEGREGA